MIEKEDLYFLHIQLRKKATESFEALKIRMHINEDEEMMDLLLEYLTDRITNFNFNTQTNRYKDISKCLKYIEYNPHKLEISPDKYLKDARKLCDITEIIDYKLSNPGMCTSSNYEDNINMLSKLKEYIYDYIHKLDKEGYNVYEVKETYKFMIDNIINMMNYDYMKQLINEYPSIVNLHPKDNAPLVDFVAQKYINTMQKNGSYNEILYYQKVLLLFIKSPVFTQDLHGVEKCLSKGLDIINLQERSIKEKQGEVLLLSELHSNIHTVKKSQDEEEKKRRNLRTKYNLNTEYTYQEREEAEEVKVPQLYFADHRDRYVITIDSPETARYEDALFFRKRDDNSMDLIIYTPDVADFIKEDGYLSKRAEVTALNYFLPDEIIHKYFSFDSGGDRYAIAYEMHFSPKYEIEKIKTYRAKVNTKQNLYYKDIKELIKNKEPYFINLYTLAKNIENNHMDKKIDTPEETYKNLQNSGNFNVGADIIRNLCIELNKTLSNTYELPFICRNHNKEGDKVLSSLPNYFVDSDRQNKIASIIKSTNPHDSYIAVKPGNKKYADFCSPLRKADALWNQRVLLASDSAEKIYKYAYEVEDHAKEINEKNRRKNYYEKELIEGKKKVLKK